MLGEEKRLGRSCVGKKGRLQEAGAWTEVKVQRWLKCSEVREFRAGRLDSATLHDYFKLRQSRLNRLKKSFLSLPCLPKRS